MMKNSLLRYGLLALTAMTLTAFNPVSSLATGISDTVHNLSAGGPGTVKALQEGELCIFCHTPHHGRTDASYLWNRNDSTANYTTYQSSTLKAAVGQPTGSSKLCLSCHDGTVALGLLGSRPTEIPFVGGLRFMPPGPDLLGTDISASHPVSLVYNTALATSSGNSLADPANLPARIHLDKNQELQCTACHDPHDDSYGNFLVMSNKNSALCVSCHTRPGWATGSHDISTAVWNGVGADPWPNSTYTTVAANGCLNCHKVHHAGIAPRLLKRSPEEDNCLVCHDGNVAKTNIASELIKTSGHKVQNFFGIHDPAEDFTTGTVAKHVECFDCHNGHQANGKAGAVLGAPPVVSGANAGVSGIDISGNPVKYATYTYEICFKCHSKTQMFGSSPLNRQINQQNTRLEFNPANPSFHPVAGLGVNQDVPSLISPLTPQSRIDCISCHNNSSASGPKGPHGSDYPFILTAQYSTADLTTESANSYALCYKCHSRATLLTPQMMMHYTDFPHYLHVVRQKAPCGACHDPHGISNTQGNAVNNSHLINFNIDIVSPDPQGRLYYERLGAFKGRCFLKCHGQVHNGFTY
ncbi:MAG: hypothetical protein GXP59_02565 [Deltaproteobacteria bacterium]|nr:hypothetical protein [Deltaproteobacteria bacterium]